jgi:hypothetical protein
MKNIFNSLFHFHFLPKTTYTIWYIVEYMAKTDITIGKFVKVSGNSGAWETGFVKNIVGDNALIGFGNKNTPDFLLRYGEMNLIAINQLEVVA